MILDNFTTLFGSINAQNAIVGQAANGAGTIVGNGTIDTGPATLGGNQPVDLGHGESLFANVSVITAPTVGTNVQFQVVQADDVGLTAGVQVLGQTDAIPIASLPAGTLVAVRLDPAQPFAPKRYFGMRVNNTGAIATATYFASLSKGMQATRNMTFKSGYAIL